MHSHSIPSITEDFHRGIEGVLPDVVMSERTRPSFHRFQLALKTIQVVDQTLKRKFQIPKIKQKIISTDTAIQRPRHTNSIFPVPSYDTNLKVVGMT